MIFVQTMISITQKQKNCNIRDEIISFLAKHYCFGNVAKEKEQKAFQCNELVKNGENTA